MSRVEEMRSLTERLAHSRAERAAAAAARHEMASQQREALFRTTAGRRAAVRRTLREVRAARCASADLLAAKLGRDRLDLARQTHHLMHGFFRDRLDRARQIRHLMNRFFRARRTMAARQRETLTAARAALADDTTRFLAALAADSTARQAKVATLLRSFHATRRALAASLLMFSRVWRQFAGAMRTSSAGGAPPPRPPRAGLPSFLVARFAEERQGEQPQRVELAGVAAAGAPFVEAPGMPLQEEVFRYLADHPDGVGVAELQSHFGASRIQMAQALNRLIEQNKARRDEERRLYFAA